MNIQKKINELINNRPKYEISPTVGEDQAIANANAFGEDRVLEGERTQLAQETANNITNAEKYAGSASSILATLSSLTNNQYAESRNLGIAGAQLRNQKIGQKYAIDQNAEAAYDKAFNWNVAGKYSDMLNQLYQRKRVKDTRVSNAISGVTTAGGLLGNYGTSANGGSAPTTSSSVNSRSGYAGGEDHPSGGGAPDQGASGGGSGQGAGIVKGLFS